MDTLYVHTPKAVKRGEPADRLFLATKVGWEDVTAYKCVITKAGIVHPGFKHPIPLEKLRTGSGRNSKYPTGSTPTAVFKPDSLYKKISYDDLEELINNSK